MKLKLYASGDLVNGHESVNVSAGGPDEAHWRSLGYVPESELQKGDDLDAMTVAELAEYVKREELSVNLDDHRLKADKLAAVRAALAGREGAEG